LFNCLLPPAASISEASKSVGELSPEASDAYAKASAAACGYEAKESRLNTAPLPQSHPIKTERLPRKQNH